jgi:ribonuclease P/MRP protein subunit RPP40
VNTEDLGKALVPNFPTQISKSANGETDLVELLEWISLAAIGSPRIQQGDLVDEIISRYEVPSISSSSITDTTDQTSTGTRTQNLTKTTFTGFMSSPFVSSIFGDAIMQLKESWFAVLVQEFEDGKALVILKTENNRVLSWDVEG